ncbi:DNA replication and repair protein RecF [mine drainage metagenome]|uniref:DNA replication and repair protein RecF n=1 Tax=mine drainage metagenome TaxID=410659 RepID=A0A1J5R7R0_9ZZZZ
MYVSHLSLTDFRSYRAVELPLEPGVTALVGPNGQGKTNLVEAVGYVATLGSHRVPTDAALVRAGCPRAVVRAKVVRADRTRLAEIEITSGKANRARINGSPVPRVRDVLGLLRTVLFAPEDLGLVKGDPDGRRRFLDELAVLVMPRMSGVIADYERIVRQRSALLKSAAAASRGGMDLRTLDVWDTKLARSGAEILAMRLALVQALHPYVAHAYEQVSSGQGAADVAYRSSLDASIADPVDDRGDGRNAESVSRGTATTELLEAQLMDAMGRLRSREIERGVCLVGPHRDDLVLTLGGLPAKGYASHGESWSFALALKLASYRLLTDGVAQHRTEVEDLSGQRVGSPTSSDLWIADLGDDGEPVLILDDVFAELDVRRRDRLAELVAPARQVLITAAVVDDVPERLVGARVDVMEGAVTRVR